MWCPRPIGYTCSDDSNSCTSNICDGDGICSHPIISEHCSIEGMCIGEGSLSPTNDCMAWARRMTIFRGRMGAFAQKEYA